MLKTLHKAAGFLICLVWFNLASAASLGGINVTSALGHPLKAEISLAELGKNDKSTLVAKLASVNEFKGAGIDYPYNLPKLNFEVATRANGEAYLKLTSTQPVNEPFVSILIELSWSSGKLLREYTFLLDPAGFVAEQPKVAEVKPVEPMVPVQEPVPAEMPLPVVAPEVAELPVAAAPLAVVPEEKGSVVAPVPVMSDMEKAELAAAESAKSEPVLAQPGKVEPVEEIKVEPLAPAQQAAATTGSVLVEKGDTLGKIADELKPVDVSLERMLVAMYRANAQKFEGKNMNRIKAGKILRMPELDEIGKVSQSAAVKEIRAQVADWQDYRQRLAAAQVVSDEKAPKQEAAGKVSTAVAEKAPVIKESAKEVLRLSKGETLGDKAIAGNGAKGKQESLTAKADDAAAKSKQLQAEQAKIAKLEEISKDASKLVELKGLPVTPPVAAKPEEKKSPEPVKPAAPVVAAPATEPAAAEFDILDMLNEYLAMLLDDPILLGAGVAVLLGLGGLGYVVVRRGKGGQKKSNKKNNEPGEVTGSWRTPVAPSPDTGDFTQTSSALAAPMSVAAALDDVDPISEADLFLNFGRDAQAEEILKDALKNNPSNMQVKLKLLSIYVTRKDSKTFSKYAQEIKDSGDASAWERAAVMGREVDPANPNYGGAKGEARHREPARPEVDFDLGLGKAAATATAKEVASADFKMDFDVSASQSNAFAKPMDLGNSFVKPTAAAPAKSADVDATSILSREVVKSAEAASPMDFDVSGILPGDIKNITQSSTMDFDISGAIPDAGRKAEQPVSMDFDLGNVNLESTAILSESASSLPSAPPAMDFNDLVFEIPTSSAMPAEEKPKAIAGDAMAFTIDFPASSDIGSAPSKPEAAKKLDIDFGDININLDEGAPPVHAGGEGKGEQWHEVATKLDLAKAYQEMGDADGAREILEEVLRDGDVAQRESADKLMQQIAA